MDRTLVLPLNPTSEQAKVLKETLEQHTACFNAVARLGWITEQHNGVELHKQTYYELRAIYPDLPAQLVCAARVRATEAVKSALTWRKKRAEAYQKKAAKAEQQGTAAPRFKPVKMPQSPLCAIRYDARSYWVKWETGTASLATIAGRIELGLTVPLHLQQYVGYQTCSADLCYRKGRFSLHVVVSIPEPAKVHTQEVIGIDLGLAHPAVTSTHVFLGERRWREQEARLFRLKRKLQAKGTKSAKRHLKRLSRKRFRQHKDHDHVLSKRIVQNTPPGATLVLENLKNIRESSKIGRSKKNKTLDLKRRFHTWSFAQLYGFIAYKAAWRGITVAKVDPRNTSQTCSHCGHQHRSNRTSPSVFRCRCCGYRVNADYNASQNIRNKYVASLASIGTSGAGGFLVSEPLVSTANG